MGMIAAVGSSKGGAGKTALCQVLAPNLVARGWRVAVVDADQNGTFSAWWRDAYEGRAFPCIHEPHEVRAVDAAQQMLTEGADIVLVDTAGFKNLTAATAMASADLVLIPCMSDRGSVIEAIQTYEQVQGLSRASRRAIPAYAVRTRWRGKGLAERAALDGLTANGVPVLASALSDLADLPKLTHSGRVPTSGKTAGEADRLTDELVRLGHFPPEPREGAGEESEASAPTQDIPASIDSEARRPRRRTRESVA
jgi:chromosome partitioning protein